MANFHETIQAWDKFDIEHLGEKITVKMPGMFEEISGKLEDGTLKTMDKETLLKWVEKHDCILPLIHSALSKRFIELRAAGRPAMKSYKNREALEVAWNGLDTPNDWHKILVDAKGKSVFKISKKISCDEREAQKRLDNADWEVIKPAGEGGKKAQEKLVAKEVETLVKSIKTMLELGLDIDTIKPKLLEKYSGQIVKIALSLIN